MEIKPFVAWRLAPSETVPLPDVLICTAPPEDVIGALVLLKFPDPEIVMFPAAWIAAVGWTVVPPEMLNVPADVKDPAPE